jgi:hypothetical protein
MQKLGFGTSVNYYEGVFHPDEIKRLLESDAEKEKLEGMKRIIAVYKQRVNEKIIFHSTIIFFFLAAYVTRTRCVWIVSNCCKTSCLSKFRHQKISLYLFGTLR